MNDHSPEDRHDGITIEETQDQILKEVQDLYPRLSSQGRDFLEGLARLPPLGSLSIEQERLRMREGQESDIANYPVTVESFPTTSCVVHLLRPQHLAAPAPILFYLHGGGWVLGDLETHRSLISQLALCGRFVVAFIEYPCAPEHVFPVPLEASLGAMQQVLQSADSLGLDASHFAIGGDSAGGNLASALILESIARNLPLPMRQVLLYPVTEHGGKTASYEEFAENPNLSRAAMEWFWNSYLPDKSLCRDARVSPLHAESALLAKFPPTLLITCEYDVLRDEAEQFATRLVHAGVEVTAVRWLGALHGFLLTAALSSSNAAQTCIEMVARYLQCAFAGGGSLSRRGASAGLPDDQG